MPNGSQFDYDDAPSWMQENVGLTGPSGRAASPYDSWSSLMGMEPAKSVVSRQPVGPGSGYSLVTHNDGSTEYQDANGNAVPPSYARFSVPASTAGQGAPGSNARPQSGPSISGTSYGAPQSGVSTVGSGQPGVSTVGPSRAPRSSDLGAYRQHLKINQTLQQGGPTIKPAGGAPANGKAVGNAGAAPKVGAGPTWDQLYQVPAPPFMNGPAGNSGASTSDLDGLSPRNRQMWQTLSDVVDGISQPGASRPAEHPSRSHSVNQPRNEPKQAPPISQPAPRSVVRSSASGSSTQPAGPVNLRPKTHDERQAAFNAIMAAAARTGDPHPEVAAAQWVIESRWGSRVSGNNNPFGIKYFGHKPGMGKIVATHEGDGKGHLIPTQAQFRNFDSLDDGVRYHTQLVTGHLYPGYRTAKNSHDALEALQHGVNGAYADSRYGAEQYVKQLMPIINMYAPNGYTGQPLVGTTDNSAAGYDNVPPSYRPGGPNHHKLSRSSVGALGSLPGSTLNYSTLGEGYPSLEQLLAPPPPYTPKPYDFNFGLSQYLPATPPLLSNANSGTYGHLRASNKGETPVRSVARHHKVAAVGGFEYYTVDPSEVIKRGWDPANHPRFGSFDVPPPKITTDADNVWHEGASFRGPAYSSTGIGPLAASYIRRAGDMQKPECGQTVSDQLRAIRRFKMTSTAMVPYAEDHSKVRVQRDSKTGLFPNDTIIYFYPQRLRNGRMGIQHWGVVYTADDGKQYLLESTRDGFIHKQHMYHIRRDRLVDQVIAGHNGDYIAYDYRKF